MVHLNDMLVVGETSMIAYAISRRLLIACQKPSLRLHPNKCFFTNLGVHYLRYHVLAEGLSTDPQKTDAVANIPQST